MFGMVLTFAGSWRGEILAEDLFVWDFGLKVPLPYKIDHFFGALRFFAFVVFNFHSPKFFRYL